jgi:peroxiredoxin
MIVTGEVSSETTTNQTKLEVPNSADEICPILTGEAVPKITYSTVDGKTFDLNAAIEEIPTILVYYRGGWCPFCNKQLEQIQNIDTALTDLGYQILAVSPDRPEKLRDSIQEKKLTYVLLSDSEMSGAKKLGIAFKVDEKKVEKYKEYDMDLEEASGKSHHLLPVPSVFVIGKNGIINFEYVNPNHRVRLDPDLLLAAAKAALK